jgi:hypothetical protein
MPLLEPTKVVYFITDEGFNILDKTKSFFSEHLTDEFQMDYNKMAPVTLLQILSINDYESGYSLEQMRSILEQLLGRMGSIPLNTEGKEERNEYKELVICIINNLTIIVEELLKDGYLTDNIEGNIIIRNKIL